LQYCLDRRTRIKDSAEMTGAVVTIDTSDPITWSTL